VEDRDDLGGSERTEGASVPKDPGRMFTTSGEDRRGNLTSYVREAKQSQET
jgi:hypothetical protein